MAWHWSYSFGPGHLDQYPESVDKVHESELEYHSCYRIQAMYVEGFSEHNSRLWNALR